ncbi:hypothetical protein AVEN_136067-1 [Araneus ventricosus]|uniref:MADF domain-containing protein n=1 Tax=Araneus ventricosus TaxID=182803 RepID=A0A4Y2AGN5_ARAVE|nr:hypothetical protein AVEN_136067-1 [Araneus ventricosus]
MACKFDVTVLCELVEARPCLWDKRSASYKNEVVRERSWEEIFTFLDDEYDAKTSSEKKETGEKIMNKWTNIRDAFIRSLKSKSGQAAKKKLHLS